MKIKLRITIEQLSSVLVFVNGYLQDVNDEIVRINLKGFISSSMKKIITLTENNTPKDKIKTITFDVNCISAVYTAMYNREKDLCPFLTAMYVDIYSQTRKQLNLLL
jgi:hypothetical protein